MDDATSGATLVAMLYAVRDSGVLFAAFRMKLRTRGRITRRRKNELKNMLLKEFFKIYF